MTARVADVDAAEIARWCRAHLGSEPEVELLRDGYLSVVVGLRLTDGREVVVKIRPAAARVAACFEVQRRLFDSGFPCPEPLVGPAPLGELEATAEAFVPGGEPMPDSARAARPFAAALAQLVGCAPDPGEVPSLAPAPSWTAWDHREGNLWPSLEDFDIDLNAVGGPAWVDEVARGARDRLRRGTAGSVIGHGDWYALNLRWSGNRLRVAHDWDSLIADSEPVIAGLAAAVFPITQIGTSATVDETREFLREYAAARGRQFTSDQLEECWAAGVWVRSYEVKRELATTGTIRSMARVEAEERLRPAGH